MEQAVAPCPEIFMNVKGKQVRSLLDSGSVCTLMNENFFKEHIEHRLKQPSGAFVNSHNLFYLKGVEEGHVPLERHFEVDVEVGGQTVHQVGILVKKDKIPLIDSKGRKAKTPALLGSNLIHLALKEFCEIHGEDSVRLFKCPVGISPLWFSTLCLYYYAHFFKKTGVGALSVSADDPNNDDHDKSKGPDRNKPKSNDGKDHRSKAQQPETKDSKQSSNFDRGRKKKIDTLGGYAGKVMIGSNRQPICIPAGMSKVVIGKTQEKLPKGSYMVEATDDDNLPCGVSVNHTYVSPTKSRQVSVILLNTNDHNVWIRQPLYATNIWDVDLRDWEYEPILTKGEDPDTVEIRYQQVPPEDLREELNTKRGAAISTDDTIGDWTLPSNKHVHFQSTPVKRPKTTGLLGEGNLDFSQHQTTGTIPKDDATATIAESILHNTMQNIASEFKKIREPKIQRFRGGTSSGALLVFNNWIQDIESTITDRNLDRQESFRLIKDFSEASARDNINFYLKSTENPTVEGLFENLRQAFSAGEDGQQMLAEFYSRHQGPKESVKEFGESLLQIARKIMTSNKDFKKDVDNSLKARFADGLKDQYHQALAREMIRNRPTLSYVAFKAEVLKTLGPSAGTKSKRLEVNQTDVSVDESPPKKRKHESEMSQQINAVLDENRKLAEKLNALDPKLIAESVASAVQSSSGSKPSTFSNHPGQKPFKPTQFYGKQKEPELVPGVDGSLKPDVNCNYCKDLGHMKFNCPKLKEKEARMAGRQSQQFKKGN